MDNLTSFINNIKAMAKAQAITVEELEKLKNEEQKEAGLDNKTA